MESENIQFMIGPTDFRRLEAEIKIREAYKVEYIMNPSFH